MIQFFTRLRDSPVVVAVIIVTGLGGTFQFGYNISVMTSSSIYIKELMNRTCVQRYNVSLEEWQVSLIWSFTVSIFCIGGLAGTFLSAPLLARFGRKKSLLTSNFFAIFGAALMILSPTAESFEMIVVGRILYGINAGINLSAHVIYVGECAPKSLRGMAGVTVGTYTSLGRFCGQLLGIRELLGTEDNWPWLLGFNGFTALFQLLTLPFLPESPSFLLMDRGDQQACEEALRRLRGQSDYTLEVEEMLEEKAALEGVHSHSVWELFHTRAVRWQLLTVLVVFVAVQLSGMSAVYFYSFEIFRAAGIPEVKLPYAALGIGLCEVFTSVACAMIIENTGRKVLLVGGYLCMSASLALLTVTLFLRSRIPWMPYCSMVLVFFVTCFYAGGPGGVSPALPAQIFTHSFKSAGYTVACVLGWVGLFIVGMIFPILVEYLQYFCFLVFLFFGMVGGLFTQFSVPETKNRTPLEVAAEYDRMHSKRGTTENTTSTEKKLHEIKTHETKL